MFGNKTLLSPIRFHPPGVGASGAGSNCVNGTVDESLKTLRVRGLPIDTVTNTVLFGQKEECLTQLSQVETLTIEARQLAALNSNQRPYLNPFKSKEPVWRTLIANKAYSGAAREPAPERYSEMYKMLLRKYASPGTNADYDDEFLRDYKLSLLNHLPSECFFITETGFYGIGQGTIEKGDQLAIWFGSPVPFVLRPNAQTGDEPDEKVFSLHGVAYIAGIMDGEMVDEIYCEDLEDDVTFTIV